MTNQFRMLTPAVVILATFACGSQVEEPKKEIRNVLFISSDDHAAYVMGAYGNSIIQTPNLDRLAASGARFDSAYVNCPFCTPSRQSIITGKLPHATGVTLVRTALSEDEVTIADHLKGFGFKTAAVGKMHFNSGPDPRFRLSDRRQGPRRLPRRTSRPQTPARDTLQTSLAAVRHPRP